MVARGYASLSFLHCAAEHIRTLDVPAYIYHLGDFDPSGVNAGEKIEETLREMAPGAEIFFERLAVTPAQIAELAPADPADQGQRQPRQELRRHLRRARRHRAGATPRSLCRTRSSGTCHADQLEALQAAEASERRLIGGLVGMLGRAAE